MNRFPALASCCNGCLTVRIDLGVALLAFISVGRTPRGVVVNSKAPFAMPRELFNCRTRCDTYLLQRFSGVYDTVRQLERFVPDGLLDRRGLDADADIQKAQNSFNGA